jgi:hypothetical protein
MMETEITCITQSTAFRLCLYLSLAQGKESKMARTQKSKEALTIRVMQTQGLPDFGRLTDFSYKSENLQTSVFHMSTS